MKLGQTITPACKTCGVIKTADNTYIRPSGTYRSYCTLCWKAQNSSYKKTSPVVKAYEQKSNRHSISLFGTERENILARDGYKCLHCGMTDKAHRERWNKGLTIDHIDGRGRYTPVKERNNDPNNLQTLCLVCHGRKDVLRRGKKTDAK